MYRHFPKKEDLGTALWDWIVTHLTHADFAARTEEQLVAAMRESFAGFDADVPLIQAMLHSPQSLDVRRRQQPARRAMFEACVDRAVPRAPPEVRERAAAVLQVLYSSASWDLLRGSNPASLGYAAMNNVAGETGQPVLGPPMPDEEARAIIARGR